MSYIIGFKDGALTHAKALGEAFQLINFLRDSKDDFDSRGRIYLPKEDMERFGVTEDHIKNSILDQAWRDLMAFEVRRAKDLLENGKQGITMLRGRGRSAVYASYLIYKKLLEEIEKENYNTFSKRIVISPLQKTMLLLKSIWTKNLQS
jgi:phytoene synthase